jgi:3-phosphoinositide dependent protein kinase-1
MAEAKEGEVNLDNEEVLTSIKDVKRGVSIREFIKSKDLGCGNFSEILICQHKKTEELFALKIIEKKRAADLAKRQHPNVYNEIQMERRVLLERLPHHHNIVRMYHAFQDYNSLYYLMDLHQGGEMWSSLRENKVMVGCHRSLAKVYLAELVDALEHMHSHGIVHRDLKPENILFTNTGHLLVIDFGTAKDLLQTDLNGPEFVGTPDFMSPEAVRGSASLKEAQELNDQGKIGADHTLDLYDLGAVAFQLHTGMTP